MELKIESRNVNMADKWKEEIEQRMADLTAQHPELTHGRVQLTRNSHSKNHDQLAEALVVVNFPRRQTLTARKDGKSFEEAYRSAFQAMEVELRKVKEKRAATNVGVERSSDD